MISHRRALYVLTLLTLILLCGCGFKLRSAAQTTLPFKTIYLGFPPTSSLAIELKRYIRANGGTEILSDPKEAEAILEVVQPERQQDAILSLNGAGQPVEKTLNYIFSFRVRDGKGRELLATTTIGLKRDISFNAAQVIAKQIEEVSLYKDMQSDMVQQILRRLVALKPIPDQ